MVCRIHYLDSKGVHPTEAASLDALSQAFPEHWVFYASVQCLLPRAPAIQLDAIVATDDRILLFELRRIRDEFSVNGDRWVFPNGVEKKSAAVELASKAPKLKGLLQEVVQGWPGGIYVDPIVVLTGEARGINLPPAERERVLTLADACSLADPNARRKLLQQVRLTARKPCDLRSGLDHALRNPRFFLPKEKLWHGYRVTQEDVVVHPDRLWREHLGEKASDDRHKALIRVWHFDRLPPSFNTPEARELIIGREAEALTRLSGLRSPLAKDGLLLAEGAEPDEILTQHSELRRVEQDFVTLHRYLIKQGQDLAPDDRRLMAARFLTILRHLHAEDLAHRDLGLRNTWVANPTAVAFTGLHVCWMPDNELTAEHFVALRYHRSRPLIQAGAANAKAADIRAAGEIVADILRGAPSRPPVNASLDGSESEFLQPWVDQALAGGEAGFADGAGALASFGEFLDRAPSDDSAPGKLRSYRPDGNPYASWLMVETISQDTSRHVWRGRRHADGAEGVVTIWPGWMPGMSTSSDLALLRLLEGVGRAIHVGRADLPMVIECGVSVVGAYVVVADMRHLLWDEKPAANPVEAVRQSLALLKAVDGMHGLDLEHGSLGLSNFGFAASDGSLVMLDLFGQARVDTRRAGGELAEAPRASDRRAVVEVALQRLASARAPELQEIVRQLEGELERATIELLEPPISWLSGLLGQLSAPPRQQLRLHQAGRPETSLTGRGERLFGRAYRNGPDQVTYVFTGVEQELHLTLTGGKPGLLRLAPTPFANLGLASRIGMELDFDILVTPDREDPTHSIIGALAAIPVQDRTALSPPTATTRNRLDIRAYWQTSLDLEEQRLPTVLLTKVLGDVGDVGTFEYRLAGQEIDFDPDDEVEAAPDGGRPIGELVLTQLGPLTLAIRFYSRRRFVVGDQVVLQEKRGRDSFQRRRRAVSRILGGQAATERLLDYFDPSAEVVAHDYGTEVSDEDLAAYELNDGQRAAFRHVVRFGPVGLQQGPPGTGKTRFIAALVHWLISRGGAERILIASQSHEAVNNAVEALVDLHRTLKERRPNALRIGTKNITPKVRPFDSVALRERYRARFDAAARSRIVGLAASLGIPRDFAAAAVDLEAELGTKIRRLSTVDAAGATTRERASPEERRHDAKLVPKLLEEVNSALEGILGFIPGHIVPQEALELAFARLAALHGELSPGDVATMRGILDLAAQWSDSLAVKGRNFEEFLAKTRPIVAATCVGAGQTKIRIDARPFDWVIIDEAARCTPSELAVPAHLGRRVLLVGDHLQLQPMLDKDFLKSLGEELGAPTEELARSDFERAFTASYGKANGRTFDEQYRMAEPICHVVSSIFYEPQGVRLITSPRRRPNLAFAELDAPLNVAVTWVDTATSPDNREMSPASNPHTFYNDAEVWSAMALLRRISREGALVRALENGPEDTPIGIICMYQAQVERMRDAITTQTWENPRFGRLVRVETVDSYQGKENSIVVMSLVRSNPGRLQGHVSSDNRCNVALSRAKERLYILGTHNMWARCRPTDPMRRVWQHVASGQPGMQVIRPEMLA